MVWVVRRFFSGNPLTRAISARTIAVVSTAGAACGAASAGADGRRAALAVCGEHGGLFAEQCDEVVHGRVLR